MNSAVQNEVLRESLEAIASEELGIRSLVEEGKLTADVRLVRIAGLAQALERAYDFGLLMGHTVAKAERGATAAPKLRSYAEHESVRAAATDILGTRSNTH